MSSGDKRSVTTDALDTLGTIIDDKQKRDAIHLAVEPVVANDHLQPGERIKIVCGQAFSAYEPVDSKDDTWWHGIVDPFLTKQVEPGERFWFVMKPREVRSLRHVWSHPDFPDEVAAPAGAVVTKEVSEEWLRKFCAHADCPKFEVTMQLLRNDGAAVINDEDDGGVYFDDDALYFSGRDAHGEIPPEFWFHAENYLGKKFPSHPTYFSCSC